MQIMNRKRIVTEGNDKWFSEQYEKMWLDIKIKRKKIAKRQCYNRT